MIGRGLRAAIGLGVVVLSGTAVGMAQDKDRKELSCRGEDDHWGRDDQETFCTIEERRLGKTRTPVRVNADPNGGVTVVGWDRDEVLVRVKIVARARSENRAEEIARSVEIVTRDEIRADGPESRRNEGWYASFEVHVPHSSDLVLRAKNGGIRVDDVQGDLDLETLNGGLSLDRLGGNVRAETVNGGVHVGLNGKRWDGEQLDVRTTNGGITLILPQSYSAELETGTINGGLDIDFPVQVRGRITRRLRTTIGDGGPPIRVVTTNGGVTVKQR